MECQRRQIPLAVLHEVLDHPEQVLPVREGKRAYQSRVEFGCGTIMLVRAVVDDRVNPALVVTVYRTSRVDKYWSEP
jgi:hypothetical protein